MTPPVPPSETARTLGLLRLILLGILVVGLAGTGIELLLLEHTEEWVQLVPLVLIALALIVVAWHVVDRRARSMRVLQATMLAFIVAGIVGTVLHIKGNFEFELEMYPTLGGLELFRDAMMGATPALSPGVMVQFGLLGLLYAFRHPALER
jgi:uncharacterized membrane protein YhaH (DUF805 family)